MRIPLLVFLLSLLMGNEHAHAQRAVHATPNWRVAPETADLSASGPAVLLPSGDLALAQPSDLRVVLFDPRTPRQTSFGRSGEGPGEFRQVRSLGAVGPAIWVGDMMSRRITVYSESRDLLWTTTLPAAVTDSIGPALSDPILIPRAVYRDGTVLSETNINPGAQQPAWAKGKTPDDVVLLRADTVGRFRNIVAWLPTDRCQTSVPFRNTSAMLPIPFCARPLYAVSGDGSRIVVVRPDPTRPGALSGELLDERGVFLGKFSIARDGIRVTSAEVDSVRAVYAKRIRLPDLLAAFNKIPSAEFLPPFTRILVSSDGATWAEVPSRAAGHHWLVIDKGGTVSKEITVDQQFEILTIGNGQIWAAEVNQDGLLGIARMTTMPQVSQ